MARLSAARPAKTARRRRFVPLSFRLVAESEQQGQSNRDAGSRRTPTSPVASTLASQVQSSRFDAGGRWLASGDQTSLSPQLKSPPASLRQPTSSLSLQAVSLAVLAVRWLPLSPSFRTRQASHGGAVDGRRPAPDERRHHRHGPDRADDSLPPTKRQPQPLPRHPVQAGRRRP